ncbi:B3 domain-containing protein REM9-like isoform X2 [Lycium barbarum]|uniref:B3 domain-containing protein REM9-like isoform X2 n=1 Tax=Lycium barbarum TaxID=112863 RepID=UPI00293E827B|nr:B3 domain-containing protein REM9-like isoform X2 [Lycium barbarum]
MFTSPSSSFSLTSLLHEIMFLKSSVLQSKMMSFSPYQEQDNNSVLQLKKIPRGFLKVFNGEAPVHFVLEGPAGISWPVGVEQIEGDFVFRRGWQDFVKKKNLEYGDFLTFCYAGNSKFYVRLYGKDGCLKQDQENVHAPPPASFELVMKKSYFTKLTIPAAFGNRFMKRGEEKFATLRTGSDSWQVRVRSGDKLDFRKGMSKFLCDNDVRVGDICRFELIDEEKFIMVVQIKRFPR